METQKLAGRLGVAVVALAGWLGAWSVAQAAVVVYTSRAAWEAAVSGVFLTEDFNAVPAGALSLGLNNAGLVQIRANGEVFFNQFTGTGFSGDTRSLSGVTQDLVFPTPVIGFGGDWSGTLTNSLLITIIDGETVQFDNHLAVPGTGFLGFVSDTPFLEARISDEGLSGNEVYGLDNLSFSQQVPEPGTLALLGLALAGVAATRRRKQ